MIRTAAIAVVTVEILKRYHFNHLYYSVNSFINSLIKSFINSLILNYNKLYNLKLKQNKINMFIL
jgi:hypothetical protein